MMGEDEQRAFELLKKNRSVQRPIIEKHNGRWLKEIGDGVLASFNSVSEAVYCAKEIQKACENEPDLKLRIGIHEGEVVFEGDDVFGDGVNIASRLEPLAPIGGILVSEAVHKNLLNKKGIESTFIREEQLKNVREPVRIYQVTVEGVEPPASAPSQPADDMPKAGNRKWILIGFSIIIIFLLGYIIYQSQSRQTTETTTVGETEIEKSIAVLPFKNLSDDSGNQYFADGVMEAILNHLSKMHDLRVISRNSMEQYRETTKSTPAIADELGVSYILEGSVQKYGDQVRITTQLIGVNPERHLWSENYDKLFEDIFSIQTEIATNIAIELKAQLSPMEKQLINTQPTSNLKAYDYYLRGRDFTERYLHSRNETDFQNAVQLLQQAINLDPEFALAYAEMGFAYQWYGGVSRSSFGNIIKSDFLIKYEEKILGPHKFFDTILQLSNKAISLNPELSRGYQLRAWSYWDKDQTQNAIRDYELAISLDPNGSWGFKQLGLIHMTLGEHEKSFMNYSRHSELTTNYSALDYTDVGLLYLHIGELEKADFYNEEGLRVLPNFYWGLDNLMWLESVRGNFKEALSYSEKSISLYPEKAENYLNHAYILAHLDRFEEAEEFLNKGFSIMDEKLDILKAIEGGHILWMNGKKEEARNRFEQRIEYCLKNVELETNYGRKRAAYDLAAAHAFLGNQGEAYKWLRYYLERGFKNGLEHYILVDPLFESLRDDKEFKEILEKEYAQKSKIRARIKKLEEQEGQLLKQ